MTGTSPEDQAKISSARNELNQKSPSIPRRAFVAARKGIEEGESAPRPCGTRRWACSKWMPQKQNPPTAKPWAGSMVETGWGW